MNSRARLFYLRCKSAKCRHIPPRCKLLVNGHTELPGSAASWVKLFGSDPCDVNPLPRQMERIECQELRHCTCDPGRLQQRNFMQPICRLQRYSPLAVNSNSSHSSWDLNYFSISLPSRAGAVAKATKPEENASHQNTSRASKARANRVKMTSYKKKSTGDIDACMPQYVNDEMCSWAQSCSPRNPCPPFLAWRSLTAGAARVATASCAEGWALCCNVPPGLVIAASY